jgi:regulator of protease activity HflC (stomatin/prohibitin superfamily)
LSSIPEILAATAVEVVLFGVAGGILYRVWRGAHFLPQRKTLMPFNKGVILEGEEVVKVLDPGSYWISPRQTIVPVDVRPRPFQMPLRDLLTSDRQGVRIRLHGEYKVSHAELFIRESSDGHAAFYLSLDREVALAVAECDRAELLQHPGSAADRIRERIEPRAAQLGIVLTHLDISDLLPIVWMQTALDD